MYIQNTGFESFVYTLDIRWIYRFGCQDPQPYSRQGQLGRQLKFRLRLAGGARNTALQPAQIIHAERRIMQGAARRCRVISPPFAVVPSIAS